MPKNQCPKPYRQFMSRFWRISECIIRGITATVLFIDQVEGEVSGGQK